MSPPGGRRGLNLHRHVAVLVALGGNAPVVATKAATATIPIVFASGGSAPQDARVALTVDRLDDGEVSPYLTDVLGTGDRLELRGPMGGYFVWDVALGGPLLLVAGGSGSCP